MVAALVAVSFLFPFAAAAVGTEAVRRLAPRLGLVDRPAARKVHETVTPLGGGLAVFAAVAMTGLAFFGAAAWCVAGGVPSWAPAGTADLAAGAVGRWDELVVIGAAAAVLVAVGLFDDLRPLPWPPRLAVQIGAAAAVAVGAARVSLFVDAPWFGVLVTTGWIVTLINSFNFLDNMNGLSGGLAVIASVTLATVMLVGGTDPHWFVAAGALSLAGGTSGFLVHNWRGRIFMGDAGSTFLGFTLGTLTAAATFYSDAFGSRHVIVAPVVMLAVPLYDTASVVLIRLQEGRSPFRPDKSHFSHRLVEMGLSRTAAVLTIYLAGAACGLAAVLLYFVPGWTGAGLLVALVACVLGVIATLETVGVRMSRAGRSDGARAGRSDGA